METTSSAYAAAVAAGDGGEGRDKPKATTAYSEARQAGLPSLGVLAGRIGQTKITFPTFISYSGNCTTTAATRYSSHNVQ